MPRDRSASSKAAGKLVKEINRVWMYNIEYGQPNSSHLAYDDYRWTDQVLLTRQGARWVILDIEWEGGGKLTGRLVAFAGIPCLDPENPSR